ncbi:PQQ-binding-like beta-propeller repeat protein [Streptomyces sp. NBC_00122]|uniref:protein kinase domain-containing protein n=1 Tax=Streptomyces sp. NBC_00122 TaxID=2903623 RepID=UPI00324E76B8
MSLPDDNPKSSVVALVGRGGMGEVWEGRDQLIERRVAVKLLPHDRRNTSGAELFFREAKTAGGLNHAGVVTVFDLGRDPDDGTLYLVMEFLTGRDLDTALRQDGPPEVATAVEWAAQTAAALQAAHAAGVVHRDLKPANLFLSPHGRVKILDFGIARYMASTNRSSKVVGTLAYMPPERFGELPGDTRSDLYSLGCVLHELLTGHIPFPVGDMAAMIAAHLHATPTPPGDIRPEVPAALDDLVLALLAKDPDDRPSSAAEVHHRLRELPTTTPTHGPDTHPPGPHTNIVNASPPTGTGPDTPEGRTTVPRTHPLHQAPTATAPTPERVPGPAAGTPPAPRRITRRTALWLGADAAAAACIPAALTLFDHTTRDPRLPPDPRLRWRYAIKFATSLAVVDGVVYVVSAALNEVYALNADTGAEKWDFTAGKNVRSLAVAAGEVYVGSESYLYTLDAATGERKGSHPTDYAVELSPTVTGEIVYTGGPKVHALDATTGTEKWAFDFANQYPTGSPTVTAGIVYIASDTKVHALDAATGTEKWASDTGGPIHSSPTVADGIVFIGSGTKVHALDTATGTEKWAFTATESPTASPTVADGIVFIGSGTKVHALDTATGTEKWAFTTGGRIRTSQAVANGIVYIGSEDHNVYAVDAATGAKEWAFTTGGLIHTSPAVANGIVYIGSGDDIYALNAATGKGPA